MDGHEVTRCLNAEPETGAVPVIMVTDRVETQDEGTSLKAAADDYVTRPFNPDVLQHRVGGVFAFEQRLRWRLQEKLDEKQDEHGQAPQKERPEIERRARAGVRDHRAASGFGVVDLSDTLAMSRSSLNRKLTAKRSHTWATWSATSPFLPSRPGLRTSARFPPVPRRPNSDWPTKLGSVKANPSHR